MYEKVEYADGKLNVDGWISAKAVSPTQETYGEMVRDGRIRGLSVSIDVLDYEDTPEGQDFKEIELWDISLTPTPRYREALMTQVNSRDDESQTQDKTEDSMNEIRKALGLAEDADEATVVAAIDGLKTKAETPQEPQSQENNKPKEPEMSDREKELLAKVAELEAKELVTQHASKVTRAAQGLGAQLRPQGSEGIRAVGEGRSERHAPDRARRQPLQARNRDRGRRRQDRRGSRDHRRRPREVQRQEREHLHVRQGGEVSHGERNHEPQNP